MNEDEFVICGNPDKHGGFVWSAPQSCGGHCKGYLADDCTTDPYRAFNYHTVFCDVKPGPLPPAICGQVPAPTAQLAGNCDYNKQVAGCTHDGTSVQLCGFNAQGNGFTWYPAAACGTGTVCREFNVNGKTTAICDFPPPAKV